MWSKSVYWAANSLEILNGGLLVDLPSNLVSDRELCQKKGRLKER